MTRKEALNLEANPPAFKGIDGEDETFRRGIEGLQLVQRKEVWSQFPQDLINSDITQSNSIFINAGKNKKDLLPKGTQIRSKIEDKRTCYKKELR